MLVRRTFPQVYKYFDSKTDNPYFLVSARSRKWGLNERKTFAAEKDALEHARKIAELIEQRGAQPQISKEKAAMADAYLTLVDKLKPQGRTPEEAVDHYIKFLGDEIIRQALPPISELVESWQAFKLTDTTLSKPMIRDIRSYARFIKSKWGAQKPDELKKNQIDILIRGLKVPADECVAFWGLTPEKVLADEESEN